MSPAYPYLYPHTQHILQGSRLVISGSQDATSGAALVSIDSTNYTLDLFTIAPKCNVFFDKNITAGLHSLKITLLPRQSNQTSQLPTSKLGVHEIA